MGIKMRKKYIFYKTDEYQEWLDNETAKSQVQIADRLSKIEMYDHWGDHKPLDEDKDVWELKMGQWKKAILCLS